MRHLIILLIISVIASLIIVPQSSAFIAQNKDTAGDELRERDETRLNLRLTLDTRVEISSISGVVEIETANIEAAEIHIVCSAQNRTDLEQYKISIENKPQSLIIRGVQRERNSGTGYGPDVLHHVKLRLPHRINLSITNISSQVQIGDVKGRLVISSIGGGVSVGDVDGQVQISNVSGDVNVGPIGNQVEIKNVGGNVSLGHVFGSLDVSNVSREVRIGDVKGNLTVSSVGGALITGALGGGGKVAGVSGGVTIDQIRGQAEIRSVAGNVKIDEAIGFIDVSVVSGSLSIGIAKLGERGVQINNISGKVELRFEGELNAQLSTANVSGQVFIEVPNATVQRHPNATWVRGVLGKSGPPIAINGVSNDVRLANKE